MFDEHTLIFVASKIEISYKARIVAGALHNSHYFLCPIYNVPEPCLSFRKKLFIQDPAHY